MENPCEECLVKPMCSCLSILSTDKSCEKYNEYNSYRWKIFYNEIKKRKDEEAYRRRHRMFY